MMQYYGINGTTYSLGSQLGNPGGEGTAYRVEQDKAAKIYKNPSKKVEDKLRVMLKHRDYVQNIGNLMWPSDVIYDSHQQFYGYIMPMADADVSLDEIYDYPPPDSLPFSNKKKIIIAKNLCTVTGKVHQKSLIIGDFNPNNILVKSQTDVVSFIDTDSYHITETATKNTFRCCVVAPGYCAREILEATRTYEHKTGRKNKGFIETPLPTFTQNSDRFALAIHIFRLLQNGCFPYDGIQNARAGSNASTGRFGHDAVYQDLYVFKPGYTFRKKSPIVPLNTFPNEIANLFTRVFRDGRRDPSQRPSAGEWYDALVQYEKNLVTCRNNILHQYDGKNGDICPYCEVDQRYRAISSTPLKLGPGSLITLPPQIHQQQRAKPNRVPSPLSLLQFFVNLEKRTRPQWESSWDVVSKVFWSVFFVTFWILFFGLLLIGANYTLNHNVSSFIVMTILFPIPLAFAGALSCSGAFIIGLLTAIVYKFPRAFAGIFVCGALMLGVGSMFSQLQQHNFVPMEASSSPSGMPVPIKDLAIFEVAEKGTVQDLRERLEGDGRMGFGAGAGAVEGSVHMRDVQYGATLLHRAAWHNKSVDVVKYLVSSGADINANDREYGATPLHWAAENENVNIAKYLVSQGADVNAKNKNGMTPLDHAKRAGNTAMVEFLSNTFTRPSAQNNNTGSQLLTASVSFGVNATVDAAQNKYNDAKRAEEEVKNKWERLNRNLPSNYELSKLRNEVEQNEEISKLCQIRDWTYDGTNIIKGELVAEFNGMIYLKDENENLLSKQKMKFSREDRTAIDKIASFFQSHKELIPESVQRSGMPNSSGSLLRLHKEIVKNLDKKILNDKEKFETVEKQIKGAESAKKEYEEAKRKTEIAEQEYDAAKSNAAK